MKQPTVCGLRILARLPLIAVIIVSCGCAKRMGLAQAEEWRSIVYTQSFARRFHLAERGARGLDPGLEAIALRGDLDPVWEHRCWLDLYVNDEVATVYPTGTGARALGLDRYGPGFFGGNLNSKDADYNDARQGLLPHWLYRTIGFTKSHRRGVIQGGGYQSSVRHVLPGLNLLSFQILCSYLDPDDGPAAIWLLRAGHEIPGLSVMGDNEAHAYGFRVPQELLSSSAPATRALSNAPKSFHRQDEIAFSIPPRDSL